MTDGPISRGGFGWFRTARGDAGRILVARGLRAFGDGFVALLVPIYLIELGFSPLAIGAVVTSTLIGTALFTLWVGMVANRYSVRRLLLACAILMAATGVGFAVTTAFWPLLLIAFVRHDERPRATPAFSAVGTGRLGRPPSRAGAPRSSRATASSARSPARSARWRRRLPIFWRAPKGRDASGSCS